MAKESNTCGNCKHWAQDKTDRQDAAHAAQDRKPCGLERGSAVGKGTYMRSNSPACRKHAHIGAGKYHIG